MLNEHQDGEHWVTNPFIDDRQKIRMFDETLTLMKKIGRITERNRILDLIRSRLVEFNASENLAEKEFILGLQLMEGLIKNDIEESR